jgi:hypothetical protein
MSQSDEDDAEEQLGHYETEQLINAISKIADLLRKCWGVAGAGIISSNLARTKDGRTVVFNPTIPGKQVYALFGFIGINDFSKQLRSLEQDVMILINDIGRVVHDEVYRWSLGKLIVGYLRAKIIAACNANIIFFCRRRLWPM